MVGLRWRREKRGRVKKEVVYLFERIQRVLDTKRKERPLFTGRMEVVSKKDIPLVIVT